MGPFVVAITKINYTHAIASIPGPVNCSTYNSSKTFPVVAQSYLDAVAGMQLLSLDANRQSFLETLCYINNATNATIISPSDFDLSPTSDTTYAAQLELVLSLSLDLSINTSTSKTRRHGFNTMAAGFAIEAGAPAVNITAEFIVVDGLTATPLSNNDIGDRQLFSAATIVAHKADFSDAFSPAEDTLTAVRFPVEAAGSHTGPLSIHLQRLWGPRVYNFTELIPTYRPLIAAAMQLMQTTPNIEVKLVLGSRQGTPTQVKVRLLPEARVTATMQTASPLCATAFPGIDCSTTQLQKPVTYLAANGTIVGATGPMVVPSNVSLPSYYQSGLKVSFTATCTACPAAIEGELVVMDANGVFSPIGTFATITNDGTGNTTINNATGAGAAGGAGAGSGSAAAGGGTGTGSGSGASGSTAAGSPDGASAPPGMAKQLGIFGFAGDTLACMDPLFGSIIAFIILVIIATIVKLVRTARRKKRPVDCEECEAPWRGPMWRSLLLQHQWLMLFLPCHEQCAYVHCWLPFAHCLTLLFLTSAGTYVVAGEGATNSTDLWLIVVAAILLSQPIRPLLAYYYNHWQLDTEAFDEQKNQFNATLKHNETMKLKSSLRSQSVAAGVDGLAALDEIELECDEEFVLDAAEDASSPKVEPNATLARLNDEGARAVDDEVVVTSFSDGDLDCDAELPPAPTAALVVSSPFVVKGHLINVVYCILMIILDFYFISSFTTDIKCSLFVTSLCWALVIDAVIIQTASVLLTYLYRWMVSDEGDSIDSELHPFHGVMRPLITDAL